MEHIPKFLIEILKNQYDDITIKKILNGFNVKRKVTLRVNNLKTNIVSVKKTLEKYHINYKTVKFYENALIIDNANKTDIQSLDIYKKGEVYLQSLSSMLPPISLNPQVDTDILDMCAAPRWKNNTNCSYNK